MPKSGETGTSEPQVSSASELTWSRSCWGYEEVGKCDWNFDKLPETA